jgi:hypothetical protein
MSTQWTPESIASLRALRADYADGVATVDLDDCEEMEALAILACYLAGLVPELLDEIERLQRGAPAESPYILKMDSQRGYA